MLTLAMIEQFDTGILLVWPLIGVAAGYGVALFDPHEGPRLLVPTLLGLVGGAVGGGIVGSFLNGYSLWESNIGAAVVRGACSPSAPSGSRGHGPEARDGNARVRPASGAGTGGRGLRAAPSGTKANQRRHARVRSAQGPGTARGASEVRPRTNPAATG